RRPPDHHPCGTVRRKERDYEPATASVGQPGANDRWGGPVGARHPGLTGEEGEEEAAEEVQDRDPDVPEPGADYAPRLRAGFALSVANSGQGTEAGCGPRRQPDPSRLQPRIAG